MFVKNTDQPIHLHSQSKCSLLIYTMKVKINTVFTRSIGTDRPELNSDQTPQNVASDCLPLIHSSSF